jgi:hypothetical protein
LGHYSGLQIAGGEGMKLVAGKGEWNALVQPQNQES